MSANLLIFVDGLQYDEALNNLKILKNAHNSRVIPGMGFSNNIYPEMLCGLSPDDIGYFNEWSPSVNRKRTLLDSLVRPLDIFRNATYINAGIRILILRKLFRCNYANIPFKYAGYFAPQGSHKFSDLGAASLLEQFDFKIIDSVDFKKSKKQRNIRDIKVFEKVSDLSLRNTNLFLSLVELDNISHNHGMESQQYTSHLEYLNLQLGKLVQRFRGGNPVCNIYLFSDHGMTPVTQTETIDIESVVGNMDRSRYLYFLDSTFLRVWIKDESLRNTITDYLATATKGLVVSEAEKLEFGISNPAFGDILFRAKEGVMFVPNFFGGRVVKAMHGYDSKLSSQSSIFSEIASTKSRQLPSRSKGIYKFLYETLKPDSSINAEKLL